MALTGQKRMRSWAWNIIKIGFDHKAMQDRPTNPENSIHDDHLSDEKQHVTGLNKMGS
jgi:hypothetical protein